MHFKEIEILYKFDTYSRNNMSLLHEWKNIFSILKERNLKKVILIFEGPIAYKEKLDLEKEIQKDINT